MKKFALAFISIIVLLTSCSTRVYHIYEVDEPPIYNGEPWSAPSLMKDFNMRFVTSDHDNIRRINVEFIIDKKGQMTELKPIGKTGDDMTRFEMDAMDALRSCQNWEPAKKRGKPVNVKIKMNISICPK